jgi:CheY-like chemotaxis protein
MDGEELARQLRQQQPALPIIIVSAYAPSIEVADIYTRVFSKPMEPLEIVHCMADMLIDMQEMPKSDA